MEISGLSAVRAKGTTNAKTPEPKYAFLFNKK